MINLLEIKNFSKTFKIHSLNKNIHASKNINIEIAKGEFVGITGKSGSGKSTILKAINRTYLTTEGEILYASEKFGDINLSTATDQQILYLRKYEIGYVSQFLNIMPRVTAREVIEKSLLDIGEDLENAKKQSEYIMDFFGINKELWDSYPNNFSGGEKLRLNIAKSMIKKPRLLLLDEPTASLDMDSKKKVKELIIMLKEGGTTMLGIFHDLEFMDGVCDKEFKMTEGGVV